MAFTHEVHDGTTRDRGHVSDARVREHESRLRHIDYVCLMVQKLWCVPGKNDCFFTSITYGDGGSRSLLAWSPVRSASEKRSVDRSGSELELGMYFTAVESAQESS